MLLHNKTGRRKVPRPAARQRTPRSISGRLSTQWRERMKFSPAPGAGRTPPWGRSTAPLIISAGSRLHPFTPLHQYTGVIIADFSRPVNRKNCFSGGSLLHCCHRETRRWEPAFPAEVCYTVAIGKRADGSRRFRRLPIQKSGGAAPRGGCCAELLTGGARSACTILCTAPALRHPPPAACPRRNPDFKREKRSFP